MSHDITLDKLELEKIRELVRDKRQALGFVGETPIANDIFIIIENLNIKLLKYPIKSEEDKQAFSAALMFTKESGEEFVFIGLNTAGYFDKQIFALAHELYHFYTKTGSHLSRLEDEENSLIEAKANRFAAEFLLPENVLKGIVLTEFKISSLEEIETGTLLRFIARMQCTWWLPYRSLVKRLKEIEAISDEQYTHLYKVDERHMNGEYGRLGKAINNEIFSKLNTITLNTGISPKDLEVIIRNFEDSLIDEDKFADTLNLFDKTPDDFGYNVTISGEDLDEFEELFKEEGPNES